MLGQAGQLARPSHSCEHDAIVPAIYAFRFFGGQETYHTPFWDLD